jgi:glycine/D-amino acid oxidase-like deaminating enzyme
MAFFISSLLAVGATATASVIYGRKRWPNAIRKATNENPQDQLGTTVIIGGGAMGLTTAYYLAKAHRDLQSPQRTVVVEVRSSLFSAASGHNSGCLAYDWLPVALKPLGEYSYKLWEALAGNADFTQTCGYKKHCLYEVDLGNGQNLRSLPSWVKTQPHWDARLEPSSGRCASMLVLILLELLLEG